MSYSPPGGWGKDGMIPRKQTMRKGSSDVSAGQVRNEIRPVTRMLKRSFKGGYGMHHEVEPIIGGAQVLAAHGHKKGLC